MQENVQVHSFTAVVIDYMDAYATARVHIVCEVDLLRTDSVVEQKVNAFTVSCPESDSFQGSVLKVVSA